MVIWEARYELGLPQMDEQHKMLVALINRLESLQSSGDAIQRDLSEVMKHLAMYISVHFRAEEKLMQEKGYSDYERHVQLHHAFEAKVEQFRTELAAGEQEVAAHILAFLKDWLITHIMKSDRSYADEFRGA